MIKVLPESFFNRSAVAVARELIGCYLVRRAPSRRDSVRRFLITETEAYEGPHDKASHASRGKTKRNAVMFGAAGRFYVYFVYGMHWMLNVVTGREGHPAAVLIRGVKGYKGPGRLTKALRITGALTGRRVYPLSGLWIEKGITPRPCDIERTARIGVVYAGPLWSKKLYRFVLSENKSAPR